MANPISVSVPKNTWVLVADNVTTGKINIKQWQSSDYYQTYRVTGDPAPTGDHNIDTSIPSLSGEIDISSIEFIDVYLYCKDLDGEVVVSL